jgi:Ni,Fe-hydrogenase III large subunit
MSEPSALEDLIRAGVAPGNPCPWPRVAVDKLIWNLAVDRLAAGRLTLIGLWGERNAVHMALHDGQAGEFAVLTHDCDGGSYPSVGQRHPPAIRLERAVRDLFGIRPDGLDDTRPWLDHGRWPVRHPHGARIEADVAVTPYAFFGSEGEHLHRIPVGPVHAGIIEPGHFRFTAGGETVVRMEARLGYTHKGVEALMAGATPERAAQLAGRVSGDSTVACAYAFARAVEAARGVAPPPRAVWLRALMAELERLANHLGDIGAICNDAAFALMHAHCGILRERVLRTADICFGHRLMRDRIVPGGVAADLADAGVAALSALIGEVRRTLPALIELYDSTTSLQDRTVGTGILSAALAHRFGAGGFVGRASGRGFDARRLPGYAPYDELRFEVPVLQQGDVNARVWIRIREVEQCLSLLDQILQWMPGGVIAEAVPDGGGEGVALVEGFRGDILVWLRLRADGTIERCHLRDPSWFQWPLLEAALEGNIVADFPLCNKSFNCSYSGHDL